MISVEMRLRARRRQDLAWLAQTSQEIQEIHEFLVRSYVEADIDEDMTKSARKRRVAKRVAKVRSPLVRVGKGSILLELSQLAEATIGIQVLAALTLVIKKGPEAASLPNRVLEAWYSSGIRAKKARKAYKRIKKSAKVQVVGEGLATPNKKKKKKRAMRARRAQVTTPSEYAEATAIAEPTPVVQVWT